MIDIYLFTFFWMSRPQKSIRKQKSVKTVKEMEVGMCSIIVCINQ